MLDAKAATYRFEAEFPIAPRNAHAGSNRPVFLVFRTYVDLLLKRQEILYQGFPDCLLRIFLVQFCCGLTRSALGWTLPGCLRLELSRFCDRPYEAARLRLLFVPHGGCQQAPLAEQRFAKEPTIFAALFCPMMAHPALELSLMVSSSEPGGTANHQRFIWQCPSLQFV